jgi:hypothetical protein
MRTVKKTVFYIYKLQMRLQYIKLFARWLLIAKHLK